MEMNQQDAYYSMMHGTYNVKLSNPMSKAFVKWQNSMQWIKNNVKGTGLAYFHVFTVIHLERVKQILIPSQAIMFVIFQIRKRYQIWCISECGFVSWILSMWHPWILLRHSNVCFKHSSIMELSVSSRIVNDFTNEKHEWSDSRKRVIFSSKFTKTV